MGSGDLKRKFRPYMPQWFESYIKGEQEERQKEKEEMKTFKKDVKKKTRQCIGAELTSDIKYEKICNPSTYKMTEILNGNSLYIWKKWLAENFCPNTANVLVRNAPSHIRANPLTIDL